MTHQMTQISNYRLNQDVILVRGTLNQNPRTVYLRNNSRMCRIVRGSLLQLRDKAIVTSTLMRYNCLALLHLLMNDWPEKCKKLLKSSFIMKVRKKELDGIVSLLAV